MILSKQMLIALCRKSLIGLDIDIKEYEEMSKADQVNFNQELTKVFYNKSFQKLLNILEKRQVIWMAREAQDDHKNFGRATINAYDLVKDLVEKHKNIFEEEKPKEEPLDKQKVI